MEQIFFVSSEIFICNQYCAKLLSNFILLIRGTGLQHLFMEQIKRLNFVIRTR